MKKFCFPKNTKKWPKNRYQKSIRIFGRFCKESHQNTNLYGGHAEFLTQNNFQKSIRKVSEKYQSIRKVSEIRKIKYFDKLNASFCL